MLFISYPRHAARRAWVLRAWRRYGEQVLKSISSFIRWFSTTQPAGGALQGAYQRLSEDTLCFAKQIAKSAIRPCLDVAELEAQGRFISHDEVLSRGRKLFDLAMAGAADGGQAPPRSRARAVRIRKALLAHMAYIDVPPMRSGTLTR